MMEETVYLRNGQAANFVKKIDDENYIVQPHIVFFDYEGNEDYDYGEKTVVSEVFKSPPIAKISEEFLEKAEAVKKKTDELISVTREVDKAKSDLEDIKAQKTDLEKAIINRSELKNAESIAVFSNRIEPYILSGKQQRELKICIYLSVVSGEESAFCYKLYSDGWGSSNKIDMEYGFLCDISDDELTRITKERAEKRFSEEDVWEITNTEDKWLPDSLLEAKKANAKAQELKKKENLKEEIEDKRKQLRELEAKLRTGK
jgi:hypothetical protein